MKKAILVFLALVMSVGMFSGCDSVDHEDPNKRYLYIGSTDGGIGTGWIEEINAEFLSSHPDVVIRIETEKDKYSTDYLISQMSNYRQDVFFLNSVNYRILSNAGVLYDMTDVVTEKIYDADGDLGGSKVNSIEDMMFDNFSAAFNLGTEHAPQYYGLPFYAAPYSFVYDVDLFEQQKLFLAEGYTYSANLWDNESCWTTGVSGDAPISAGQDKIPGNYDDGLPETWNDFVALMDRIVSKNMIPFTWSGEYIYQRIHLLEAIWANYEGASNFGLNNTFNGTDSNLGEINETNAYKLQSQTGKKAAIKAAYDIMSKQVYYSPKTTYSGHTHTDAQLEYLASYDAKAPNKQIAMLLEGSFWENEANALNSFADAARGKAERQHGVRRFGYMPVPAFKNVAGVPDQTNEKRTVFVFGDDSIACINGYSDVLDLAIEYMQFVHSRKSLAIFTANTGVVRGFDYSLTPGEYNRLTPYGKSVLDAYTDPNVDVAHLVGSSELRDLSAFTHWSWRSAVGDNTHNEPFGAFLSHKSLTIDQYFNGMRSYYEPKWQTYLDLLS